MSCLRLLNRSLSRTGGGSLFAAPPRAVCDLLTKERGAASAPLESRWLLDDVGDHPRANRPAALADGEPERLVHRDRLDQLDLHLRVVPGHHHLGALRELADAG